MAQAVYADTTAEDTTRSVVVQTKTEQTVEKQGLSTKARAALATELTFAQKNAKQLADATQHSEAIEDSANTEIMKGLHAIAANIYHIPRHPINTLKRLFGSLRFQLTRKSNYVNTAKIVAIAVAIFAVFLISGAANKSSYALIKVPATAAFIATICGVIAAPCLSPGQAMYDNLLSSGELRTKNIYRRLCGWVYRHRLTLFFGYDRGSVQNTEMLLKEYADLPANADKKIRSIYREELQDMLDRWAAGSEDANPELQARVEAALAA